MKPKLDLVSMLLVNANGLSPVPDIKKEKAREDSAGMRPAENTLMLKSNYKLLKGDFSQFFLNVFSVLTLILFPLFIVCFRLV